MQGVITLLLRYWYIAAIAALVALLGVQQVRVSSAKQAFAEYRAQNEANIRAAAEAQRAEEQRRQAAVDEEAKNVQKQIEQLQNDLRDAAAAADSLRGAAAAAAGRARKSACAPAGGKATRDDAGVLAIVLGMADEAAGRMAEAADRARTAGAACERSYDALTIKR